MCAKVQLAFSPIVFSVLQIERKLREQHCLTRNAIKSKLNFITKLNSVDSEQGQAVSFPFFRQIDIMIH